MIYRRFAPFRRFVFVCCLLSATGAVPLRAEVRLAGVFGDHMVLQRDVPLTVWGKAGPGEKIEVRVAGQSVAATADSGGNWRARLQPLPASATPVKFAVTGENTVELQDVLVGDVWLCAGQSNMVYPVYKEAAAAEELPKADHPDIRLCGFSPKAMREPLADRKLSWAVCTPATAKTFSAVGYYFGRALQSAIGVPVGLVSSAVSGTPAQSWTSLDGLKSDAALKPYLDAYEQMKNLPAVGKGADEAAPGTPASLFNGMVAPLTPFAIKGVVWYQGESNTGTDGLYQKLLPALIGDWRRHWGQEKLPFLIAQLPGFGRRQPELVPSKWAAVREAQALAQRLPDTGLAVTIDLSAPRNILHPPNKREIGRRLALVAREKVYGEKIESSGPVFKSAKFDGNKVRITFDHAGSGLVLGGPVPAGSAQPPEPTGQTAQGFAVAGADRIFVRATAAIDGNAVVVSSAQIAEPAAVRYGWEENPQVNLCNREGLPASPFRTDNWPLVYPAAAKGAGETNEVPKF